MRSILLKLIFIMRIIKYKFEKVINKKLFLTLQIYINKTFKLYINVFYIIYLNYVLIYFETKDLY